jgi:type IV pilus assembly protein PilV
MRTRRNRSGVRRARGFTLIELLISMTVLAVGLVGLLGLILSAMVSNNRNRADSASTFMAAMVMDQIVNQPPAQNPTLTLTDCKGNSLSLTTAAGGATLYTTSTAPTASQVNNIDFTQAISSVPSGYQIFYTTCDSTGNTATFDIRWNIATLNSASKYVTVGARPMDWTTQNIRLFAPPVTLRTIATN